MAITQGRRRFVANAAVAGAAGFGGLGGISSAVAENRSPPSPRRKLPRSAWKGILSPALRLRSSRNCCAPRALPISAT